MASDRHRLQPRKQPRQVRAELTRQRILTAAAHVFAEYGYAAGTTNRIAERAGVSIGSLYQYYPGKDAILLELMTRHLDSGAAAARRRQDEELAGPGSAGSIEDVMRVFVRTAIDNHRDDPRLLRVMMEQTPRSPELWRRVAELEAARVGYVRELLDRHADVRVEDTGTAARVIVTTIETLVHHLIASPDPVDVTSLENELVAMLTRYLTAGGGGGPDGGPGTGSGPG